MRAIIPVLAVIAIAAVWVPWRYYSFSWMWLRDKSKTWFRVLIYFFAGVSVVMLASIRGTQSATGIAQICWVALAAVAFFVFALLVVRNSTTDPQPAATAGLGGASIGEELKRDLAAKDAELSRATEEKQALLERAERAEKERDLKVSEISQINATRDYLANQATAAVTEKEAVIAERDKYKQRLDDIDANEERARKASILHQQFEAAFEAAGKTSDQGVSGKAALASIHLLEEHFNKPVASQKEYESWREQLEIIVRQIAAEHVRLFGEMYISQVSNPANGRRKIEEYQGLNADHNKLLNEIRWEIERLTERTK